MLADVVYTLWVQPRGFREVLRGEEGQIADVESAAELLGFEVSAEQLGTRSIAVCL